jgi:hypothetical protein
MVRLRQVLLYLSFYGLLYITLSALGFMVVCRIVPELVIISANNTFITALNQHPNQLIVQNRQERI